MTHEGETRLSSEGQPDSTQPQPQQSPDDATRLAGPSRRGGPEAEVSAEWNAGDVILDTYEVKGVLGVGGFGKVYLVHHRDWDIDMAVKSPTEEALAAAGGKENFVRECHTWMDLGLHLHIVTCHYVRVLGGIPRVFAEYANGGSLKDWIKNGRLYVGDKEKALERILDISIQFARGLHYAHEKGLIHQDVKPANVMIALEEESDDSQQLAAKVTDFGLARARSAAGPAESIAGTEKSILVSSGGMTPAYCSPEQAGGEKLTRKTDIWSWAVSILEMFTGEVTWPAGQVAGEALQSYLRVKGQDLHIPIMPKALAELLHRCFQESPEDRPKDMQDVGKVLEDIYRAETGIEYPHEASTPPTGLADVLNNKAISFLELGMVSKAETLWAEALKLDPHHIETSYNAGLHEWRTAKITDQELVCRMEEVCKGREGKWCDQYLLSLVHLERGDGEATLGILDKLIVASENDRGVATALKQARRLVASCRQTLKGHSSGVSSVALSADCCRALSGSMDNTLRLWDLSTGRCLRMFEGHKEPVRSVCLSGDGLWALSGSGVPFGNYLRMGEQYAKEHAGKDSTLRLWEVSTGQCVRIFEGHEDMVYSVSMSADERWVLSGSADSTVRLWEVSTGRCVKVFHVYEHGMRTEVTAVRLSPNGQWLLYGTVTGGLMLRETATERCIQEFNADETIVYAVCLSPDERWVLSGHAGRIRLWEVSTGRCTQVFKGHDGLVTSVSLSDDGQWLASGSTDRTVRIWDVLSGRCVRTFKGHKDRVLSVYLRSDGRFVLSGSNDKTLCLWRVASIQAAQSLCRVSSVAQITSKQSKFFHLLEDVKTSMESGRYRKALALLSQARNMSGYAKHQEALTLWNEMRMRSRIVGFRGGWELLAINKVSIWYKEPKFGCLSENGRWGLTGGEDRNVRLWDISTGCCIQVFEGHDGDVTSISLSADGRWLASGSSDKTVRIWDVSTGKCSRILEGHTETVNAICASQDWRWALSVSVDRSIRLWDLSNGECVRIMKGHEHHVTSLCLTADGQWALTGSWGNPTFCVWNLRTGQCVRSFASSESSQVNMCVSADGRRLLAASNDMLGLWDVSTGCSVWTSQGYSGNANRVCMTRDGNWALSGHKGGKLHVWEVPTGRLVKSLDLNAGSINFVRISADSRLALCGEENGSLRVWSLDWELQAQDAVDWDEGARPYLVNFLTLHTPYATELPWDRDPSEEESQLALTRQGKPVWNEEEFKRLLHTLSCVGYGWLRPEGVKRRLEQMAHFGGCGDPDYK